MPPKSPNLDPRAQRSRQALRDALGDMLCEMRISEISILALTQRAGVGYATFFRNYPDIDAVLAELSQTLIDELSGLISSLSAREDSARVAAEIARFASARRIVLTPLFVGASAVLQRDIIARATRAAKSVERPRNSAIPPAVAIAHPVMVVVGLLTWWLSEAEPCQVAALADLIDRLAFRPLV